MTNNKSFLESFKIAFLGIISALKKEKNFRIIFLIGVIVILFTIIFKLNSLEKSIVFLTIFIVLSLELINSQIEKFLDLLQPEKHPKVKVIKDFSAAAVLLFSFGSLIIGVLIFLPYLIEKILKM